MRTMKAPVIYEAGGPEVLKIESRPIPTPQPGEVLIRVKAFGLNRSELFTRQGLSPGVVFPRVLGIEAVGLVEEAPGGEFNKGDIVATAMGGMGRNFDGGYAEYTCVPASQVQVIKTSLPWKTLGALPEMLPPARAFWCVKSLAPDFGADMECSSRKAKRCRGESPDGSYTCDCGIHCKPSHDGTRAAEQSG